MFIIIGIALALTVLLLLYTALSLFAHAVLPLAIILTRRISQSRCADCLWLLNILPATASGLFVLIFALPAYWIWEPRLAREVPGQKLLLLACLAILLLLMALSRAVVIMLRNHLLLRRWMRSARPCPHESHCPYPVFEIDIEYPLLAVIGVRHSQLWVASCVRRSLSLEEFEAALQHEVSHVRHNDNFKRWCVRLLPDLFSWVFPASPMAHAWEAASEKAADASATLAGSQSALHLASALIKVARLLPAHPEDSMAEGAYLVKPVGPTEFTMRVDALIRCVAEAPESPVSHQHGTFMSNLSLSGLLMLALLAASSPFFLQGIHEILEGLFYVLK